MKFTLAIDFGSTNTKAVALDLAGEELLGVAQASSTVGSDIMIGLRCALDKLRTIIGQDPVQAERIVACSSAAGGLRMVAAGLVKQLTTKVAEEAALGAGAKMVGTFSYGLSPDEVKSIEQIAPDMILLTGGVDGGDERTLMHNARAIAESKINSPIVVAGNKKISPEARTLLEDAGKMATVVPNVLPELDQINVEPAREAIREIFMRRIVHAKGLDQAQALVGDIIMPTPMAVLQGARLIAAGAEGEAGTGDLIVVDVGGATTNIHSIAEGQPSRPGVIWKGLPEPVAKRTVEGDLGIRYNARVILHKAGEKTVRDKMALLLGRLPGIDLEAITEYLSSHVEFLPQNLEQSMLDVALAHTAVDMASRRHAGKIEEVYFPTGKAWIQQGKDLTLIRHVIGTGGILAHGRDPLSVIKAVKFNPQSPESLRPASPDYFIDKHYILYSIGLLVALDPVKAMRIAKKYILQV
jgi:uncharacterized protein (TIGR01319 family)